MTVLRKGVRIRTLCGHNMQMFWWWWLLLMENNERITQMGLKHDLNHQQDLDLGQTQHGGL